MGTSKALVVVVGAGLSGLAAAVEAFKLGATVFLFEKRKELGGGSYLEASGINACNTKLQRTLNNSQDSQESFLVDLKKQGQSSIDELARILVQNSNEAIEWLEEFGLEFDQLAQFSGHSHPRTHISSKIQTTLGEEISRLLINYIKRISSSVSQRQSKASITVHTEKYVTGFLTNDNDNEVIGITFKDNNDQVEQQLYADSVVLATGGFYNDRDGENPLLSEFIPHLMNIPSVSSITGFGSGIKMVRKLKGSLIQMHNAEVYPTGFINPETKDVSKDCIAPESLREYGGIMINPVSGKRFVNEVDSANAISESIFLHCPKMDGKPLCIIVANEECLSKFGVFNLGYYIGKGIFKQIEGGVLGLAEELGISRAILANTFLAYNNSAKLGKDDFGKTTFPTTFELKEKLYIAFVTPVLKYTLGGVGINRQCQVLKKELGYIRDQPISGLFAAGEVTGGVHGEHLMEGNKILESIVFGRIAAENAATIKELTNDSLEEMNNATTILQDDGAIFKKIWRCKTVLKRVEQNIPEIEETTYKGRNKATEKKNLRNKKLRRFRHKQRFQSQDDCQFKCSRNKSWSESHSAEELDLEAMILRREEEQKLLKKDENMLKLYTQIISKIAKESPPSSHQPKPKYSFDQRSFQESKQKFNEIVSHRNLEEENDEFDENLTSNVDSCRHYLKGIEKMINQVERDQMAQSEASSSSRNKMREEELHQMLENLRSEANLHLSRLEKLEKLMSTSQTSRQSEDIPLACANQAFGDYHSRKSTDNTLIQPYALRSSRITSEKGPAIPFSPPVDFISPKQDLSHPRISMNQHFREAFDDGRLGDSSSSRPAGSQSSLRNYNGIATDAVSVHSLSNYDKLRESYGSRVAPSVFSSQQDNISETQKSSFVVDSASLKTGTSPLSLSEALGENESMSLSEMIKSAKLPKKSFLGGKQTSTKMRDFLRHLRYCNFLRSILTTVYGFIHTFGLLNSPVAQEYQATNFFMISLFFYSVDLIVAFAKAFPLVFWFCWNVKTWDPFSRSFSIWNLIADHELLLDTAPVLVNLILRIYNFRFNEVVGSKPVPGLPSFSRNQALLFLFIFTLAFIFILHTVRLCRLLVVEQRNAILAFLVSIKTTLLALDVTTNGLLLYIVLLQLQKELFIMNTKTAIVLSIISVAPAVTLTTNVIVNLPLHYFYLRMQLAKVRVLLPGPNGIKKEVAGSKVPFSIVIKAALRKAFHPLITGIFGTYALYSTIALLYLLTTTYPELVSTTSNIKFAKSFWRNGSSQILTFFFGLLWLNLAFNYLVGVFTCLCYWIWFLVIRRFY